MKYIFVNLKRFDVPPQLGGVNRIAPIADWGGAVAGQVDGYLRSIENVAETAIFFPEAHIIPAAAAKGEGGWHLGVQGVHRSDIAPSGNFGALTTSRSAVAMCALGCTYAIIGHCEERMDKAAVLAEAGVSDSAAVNRILHAEVRCALASGLKILYCVGEKIEEQDAWQQVISDQLEIGLAGADLSRVCVAYEPVWAIGPGRPVPDAPYIRKIAAFIKEKTGCPVIYGGGLKEANAEMLSSIAEIDGGLVALTRFEGEIGFYPEEFIRIAEKYLAGSRSQPG